MPKPINPLREVTHPLRHGLRLHVNRAGQPSVRLLLPRGKEFLCNIPGPHHPFAGLALVELTDMISKIIPGTTRHSFLEFYQSERAANTKSFQGFDQRFRLLEDAEGRWWFGAKYSHSDKVGMWDENGVSVCAQWADPYKMYQDCPAETQLVHVTTAAGAAGASSTALKSMARAFTCAMALREDGSLPPKAIQGKFGRPEYSKVLVLNVRAILESGTRILMAGDGREDSVYLITKDVPNEHFEVVERSSLP